MMTAMTYEELITDVKNNSKVIALIYSPLELHEYIVEIISNDSDKFIRTGDEVIHFHSIDSALSQATLWGKSLITSQFIQNIKELQINPFWEKWLKH